MNGIFYARHGQQEENREQWAVLADGQEIVVRAGEVWLHLPGVTIPDAEFTFHCCGCCPRHCDAEHRQACRRCSDDAPVRLALGASPGQVSAAYAPYQYRTIGYWTHHLGSFDWGWDGSGATEWWFDEGALCVGGQGGDYTSQSGLTATRRRLVAYTRKVQVASFRDYGGDARPKPAEGVIAAKFANRYDTGYRANWTGQAYGLVQGRDEYGNITPGHVPIIGDDLDVMIQAVLDARPPVDKTVCRHLGAMQAYIVCRDPKDLPRFLCTACRMQGVRWEEFLFANKADTCPYFLRAVRTVTQRSDPLPDWYDWRGPHLMGQYSRLQDEDWSAYETVYLTPRDQFVRHGVLLLNAHTREAWTYAYAGFIPRTMAEFRQKYADALARQVQGYGGTGWNQSSRDYLTEEQVREEVAEGNAAALWESVDPEGRFVLIPWRIWRDDLQGFALQRGTIAGLEIVPLTRSGDDDPGPVAVADPQAFYVDHEGSKYYLLMVGQAWVGGLALRHSGEAWRTGGRDQGPFFLLRVKGGDSE